ncbi:hypothetical protein HZH66_006544 [Vespula vulgaris]|uniref:Uncharacterized protein n=1 Tax=Vespula vulgaris TaxID=7454 RepID=A0A834K242_VESVU|nr:hypothetical protein HZH66_006544 [Vespula vulgaris]
MERVASAPVGLGKKNFAKATETKNFGVFRVLIMDAWHLDPTLLSDLYNSLDQFAEANRITVPPRTSKSRLHREDIGSLISGRN